MARNTETHGQHQEVHIRPFRSDRYGVWAGSIERHVKEDFDSPQWGLLSPNSAPGGAPVGLPCVTVERSYDEKTGYGIYTYAYEGLPDNFNLSRVFCNCDGTDREEPIETSPLWADIKKKYKATLVRGSISQFTFPPTWKDASGKTVTNPLLGSTHFMTVGLLWTRTYAVKTVPASLYERVDTIDTPVGNGVVQPPKLKAPRNWLKLSPGLQQRGNVIQIVERWMSSGRSGFNPDVYSPKTGTGGGTSLGNTGGLTTGSLSSGGVGDGLDGSGLTSVIDGGIL